MRIISDVHVGTTRQAGTTPYSQTALKTYIEDEFRRLVMDGFGHLVINGDLFDRLEVPAVDVISVAIILSQYLDADLDNAVTLIMGNHDSSAKAGKVSGFHLLSYILTTRYGLRVTVIDNESGFSRVWDNVAAISHQLNQSLFDLEIEKALTCGFGGILLLHCNIECGYCEQSDHSLNLSSEQVGALVDAGWTLVVGHEHQQRVLRGGKVVIPGNQICSSVSDCLHNPHNTKQYAEIVDGQVVLKDWMNLDNVFQRINWRNLIEVNEEAKFIRVDGDCSADEAADMVNAIAKLRQRHSAFVISNAVKTEGMAEMDALTSLSTESISKFNVLEALLSELTEAEGEVVKGLLND